jgi:hypothetical protein
MFLFILCPYVVLDSLSIHNVAYSGNKKSMIIKLNEIAYTELFLLIDVKISSSELLLTLLEDARPKDYPEDNGNIAYLGETQEQNLFLCLQQ